jgi:hypothetical protein
VLGTVGKHKGKFSKRRKPRGSRAEQDRPQLFSQGGAARLPRRDNVNPALTQVHGQIFQLRGFAHAIQAFKSDEFPALWKRHDRDLIIN